MLEDLGHYGGIGDQGQDDHRRRGSGVEVEAAAGKRRITPYWRTLKTGGELNPEYPGGIKEQRALLESEGHEVVRKGRKTVVDGYEKSLVEIERM